MVRCAARCRSHGHGCPDTISTPASMGSAGPVTQITRQRALLSPNCTPMTSPTRSFASSPESRAPRSLISRVWAFREKGRPTASMPNTRTARSATKRGSGGSDMQWWRARHFEAWHLNPDSHAGRASMPPFQVRLQGLLQTWAHTRHRVCWRPLIMGRTDWLAELVISNMAEMVFKAGKDQARRNR
jgi:hypothetical protein